jgi:branched-subunit amino acid aminotransferase/4-amino-4-deoxychorismate lyase
VSSPQRLEIDGQRVSAEVASATMSAFGHFTAMQVRSGRTRGLALHLGRLEAANRELFDAGLDGEGVRALVRHALNGTNDASVRIYVFETDAEPAIVVTVREPAEMASPQRLQPAGYQRPDAHLKHLATGQGFYSRRARSAGFDDALLTGDDGVVSETANANIGLFESSGESSGVVWPDAPLLRGITMQLLDQELPKLNMTSRRASVRVEDIPSFQGAFLSSARGVAAVSAIDDVSLAEQRELMRRLAHAYASVPWETI